MIRKVYAKFDGSGDIECVCDAHHRKCKDDSCKEYVVKFIEVERSKTSDALENLDISSKKLDRALKKFETQVSKSIKKFKI